MNDYLLESQKRDRRSNLLRINNNSSSSDHTLPQVEPEPISPTKNSTAYKILTIERQAKINVTFNNICIILFFTLFPLGIIAATFGYVKWFLMVQTAEYNYWVNLFFIQKSCTQDASLPIRYSPLCQDSQTVYFHPMILFYINGCKDGDLTKDDPSNLCTAMASSYYSGLLAGITIILGLFLHIFHIIQLMRITFSRNPNLIRGFHPLRVAYFVMFLYIAPFVYWLFASASIINYNSKKDLLERFGLSFYSYLASVLFYVLLVLWFRKVYKKGIRRNLVNTLLNAERKYESEFERDQEP